MIDLKKEHSGAPKSESSARVEAPEVIAEKAPENLERPSRETETKSETEQQTLKRMLHRPKQHVLPVLKDPTAQKVEKILEENVGEAYSRLSPIAKQEFKLKGEAVAKKIAELLKSTHVKVKKIFQLIVEWLRLLPGVNKFFLEQEAKIKTDKIIALHNRDKHL